MEIYYAIVNILDYLAKNEGEELHKTLIDICYKLLPYIDGENDVDKIQSISDANDCGNCTDFETIVIRLRGLFASGERV